VVAVALGLAFVSTFVVLLALTAHESGHDTSARKTIALVSRRPTSSTPRRFVLTQAMVCDLLPDPHGVVNVRDWGTGGIVRMTYLDLCNMEAAVEPSRPAVDDAGLSFDYTFRNGQIVVTYHEMYVHPDGSIDIPADAVPVEEARARIVAVR
jgi:hypothetical protein